MPSQLEQYRNIITTDRSAKKLARKHGFRTVKRFAASLPPQAWVLDAGAGASPFGRKVCALRPDIVWFNFDFSYRDPAILAEVSSGAPPNVIHMAGDVMLLVEIFGPEAFHVVCSYWLLPHLSIYDDGPARRAAVALYSVARADGRLSIGPRFRPWHRRWRLGGKTVRHNKDESLSRDEFADLAVAATRLSPFFRAIQVTMNEALTPFFGTTRYAKRAGWKLTVYDPASGRYISPLTLRGLTLARELSATMFAYFRRHTKPAPA